MTKEYQKRILAFLSEYLEFPPGVLEGENEENKVVWILYALLYLITQKAFTAADLKATALREYNIIIPDEFLGGATG